MVGKIYIVFRVFYIITDYSVDWWALGVLMFEMLAGRSPFDIVGSAENPDQNTEDYLFQVILEKPIRIPRSLSVRSASILKGFLNKVRADTCIIYWVSQQVLNAMV